MKLPVLLLMASAVMTGTASVAQDAHPKEMIYAGSFSVRGSKGLYVFQFDRARGKLTEVQTVSEGSDPSFLTLDPGGKYLYAIYDKGAEDHGREGCVMSFRIDPATGLLTKLNEQSSGGRGPAHVSIDPRGRFLYVSNYGSGTLAVYPLEKDGRIKPATDVIQDQGSGPHPNQKGPHVHAAIPSADGRFVYVCDLGIDKVWTYRVGVQGKLTPAVPPFFTCKPGSGPRQFALSSDGRYGFLVEELISNLVSFRRDVHTGALTPLEHFDLLPEGYEETGSDATVFVSPDDRFVYASNWGPKGLAIYAIDSTTGKLAFVDNAFVHGAHPRDFCIDREGDFVFVANMGSDNLVVLRRDRVTGKLTYTGSEAAVPAISCIRQLLLP